MNCSKRAAFSLVLFSTLGCSSLSQGLDRKCVRESLKTPTRWGGNERIEIDLRDKPMSALSGTVEGPGEGTLSTLVQAYRRKPSGPLHVAPYQENELPTAACMTGSNGFFSFSLPPGVYELRMSQNAGGDVTSVLITVKHGSYRSESHGCDARGHVAFPRSMRQLGALVPRTWGPAKAQCQCEPPASVCSMQWYEHPASVCRTAGARRCFLLLNWSQFL